MSSPPGTTRFSYRPDIDGLRAIAVLSVVLYHAFPGKLHGGFVGVDIFFVISGYLISGHIFESLKNDRFSYRDFYERRIRRIFPALFTVLASSLIAGWFLLFSPSYKELGLETAAGAGFIANWLFWSQAGYFDIAAQGKPLLHLWSLGIEEQFYIAWPLIAAFCYRRDAGRSSGMRLLVITLLLASFCWNLYRIGTDPNGTFYLPMARFWELLLGVWLSWHTVFKGSTVAGSPAAGSDGARTPLRTELLAIAGLALLVASLLIINDSRPFPGAWALLPTCGTLALLSTRSARVNRLVLGNRAMAFIGLISYPLYLWHWVMLIGANELTQGTLTRRGRLLAVALAFLLAWLTWRFIEKPLRFGGRTRARVWWLTAAVALCGVSGGIIAITDGAAFRYPAVVRQLAAYHYDARSAYREGHCQMDDDEPFSALAADCVDAPRAGSKLLVIWGDSHSSSLYQGLRTAVKERPEWRLAQFTAGGCPPLPSGEFGRHRSCQQFGRDALARIRELQPDIVVLGGYWLDYAVLNGQQAEIDALLQTIAALRAAGVGRVVVFADLPRWLIEQPMVALRLYERSGELVTRTHEYIDHDNDRVDAALQAALVNSGAEFIAPIAVLCNSAGCPLSTDAAGTVPVTWDNSHLTTAGSNLLIGRTADRIFGTATSTAR